MCLKLATRPWDSLFLLRARLYFLPRGHEAKLSRPPEHRHLCSPRRTRWKHHLLITPRSRVRPGRKTGGPLLHGRQAGDLEGPAWWPEAARRAAGTGRVGLQPGEESGGGGAEKAPIAHVILPQASLSGFWAVTGAALPVSLCARQSFQSGGRGEEGLNLGSFPLFPLYSGWRGKPQHKAQRGPLALAQPGPALPGPACFRPPPPPPLLWLLPLYWARRKGPRPRPAGQSLGPHTQTSKERIFPPYSFQTRPHLGRQLSPWGDPEQHARRGLLQQQVPSLLCLVSWHRAWPPPGPRSTKLSPVSLSWAGEGTRSRASCPQDRTWETSLDGAFGAKEQG